jgi:lipopolysaccharide biosynthesis protein
MAKSDMNLISKFNKHMHEDGLGETMAITFRYLRSLAHPNTLRPFGAPACAVYGGTPVDPTFERADGTPRILVQAHMFFPEDADEIVQQLNCIPYSFDVLVSTDTEEKRAQIEPVFKSRCRAHDVTVQILENHGRDVLPFLTQVRPVWSRYDYLCHIHSKHSGTVDWGDMWRRHLYGNLFGSTDNVAAIFDAFESDDKLGIVFPERFPMLIGMFDDDWDKYVKGVRKMLSRLGVDAPDDLSSPVYPAGTMFWARMDAVRQVFEQNVPAADDFVEENGQIRATAAHVMERIWVYLAEQNGYGYRRTVNFTLPGGSTSPTGHAIPEAAPTAPIAHSTAVFIAFYPDGKATDTDIAYLKALRPAVERIVFVNNGDLDPSSAKTLSSIVDEVVERDNVGYDFGAWQEALLAREQGLRDSCDLLLLINNSCFAPICDIDAIIRSMHGSADFWGMSSFPKNKDYRRHVQSYFMGFERDVVSSDAFWDFWHNLPKPAGRDEAIANGEALITSKLEEAGFSWDVWCPAQEIFGRDIADTQGYCYPYEMAVFGNPLIKKKCVELSSIEELDAMKQLLERLPDHAPASARATSKAFAKKFAEKFPEMMAADNGDDGGDGASEGAPMA